MLIKAISLVSLIFFFGCSARSGDYRPKAHSGPKSEEQMVYIKPKLANYKTAWSDEGTSMPNWIFDPSMGGKYESGVGSCKMTGLFSEYSATAYGNALNEICQARRVRVKGVFKDFQAESNSDVVSYQESTSKLETLGVVDNAKIVSSWIKVNTNEYFVWVVVNP